MTVRAAVRPGLVWLGEPRRDWASYGVGTAGQGLVRHGSLGRGMVRIGGLGPGAVGPGRARHGKAWQSMDHFLTWLAQAWCGPAGQAAAWRGLAWHRSPFVLRPAPASQGEARSGPAGRGEAGRGEARQGFPIRENPGAARICLRGLRAAHRRCHS